MNNADIKIKGSLVLMPIKPFLLLLCKSLREDL